MFEGCERFYIVPFYIASFYILPFYIAPFKIPPDWAIQKATKPRTQTESTGVHPSLELKTVRVKAFQHPLNSSQSDTLKSSITFPNFLLSRHSGSANTVKE
jgi:hypothetical protein